MRSPMNIRINSVLLFAVLAFVMPAAAFAAHGKAADEVQVSNAYARAVPATQKNSGIFMTLMNKGHMEHAVVRASSKAAENVELHTHINDGGMMRMRPIDKIDVAAGGHTELKPGGLHVMLIGLTGSMEEGGMVHLTLEFEDGSSTMVMVPVKKVQAMSHGSHEMKGHDMKGHEMKDEHEQGHGMQEKKHDMHEMKEHKHSM